MQPGELPAILGDVTQRPPRDSKTSRSAPEGDAAEAGALSFSAQGDWDNPDRTGPPAPIKPSASTEIADIAGPEEPGKLDSHESPTRELVSTRRTAKEEDEEQEEVSRRQTLETSNISSAIEPVPRREASWRPELAREQPFQTATRREAPSRADSGPRQPTPTTRSGGSRTPSRALEPTHEPAPRRTDPKLNESALLGNTGVSSLDAPRRLVDIGTGLPSFTALFSDLRPLAELPTGVTVLYVHVPSSAIVEERFGWEALEAYRGLIANFLVGYAQDMRRDREECVVARAFADDFVIVTGHHEQDSQLSSALADAMTRHLLAIDEETAALLQVYVGVAVGKPFLKVHPERFLYRLIQQAQTEATDVGRQKISAHVRVLDRCISGELFHMVYQPIVRVSDHSISAYEALVRCTQKELRSPMVLFNVAEQGDRIWALSRLRRRMALRAVPELPEGADMFVNLHPRDFDDPDILEPEGPIATNAKRVVIEVTERAAIIDLDHFRDKLAALRAFGARIAIDDLGSGYSALNLVAELNPDLIKLDMTLIRGVDESPVRQNLLRNMLAFANDLGAKVVAEGVETRSELETLCDLGCDLVQGYYLAVPSPPFVLTIQPPPTRPRTPT